MAGLKLAPGLELPVDVVGESTAILAKKGAGKSNTAKVIVEETLDHGGVQVVVLDPIGHWWSLRAGANGKPGGGYAVAVFGGMHGDLPLEETAGKVLAQTVVESGQSIVLDVSSLDSNGAMQRFVYEFLEELYRLKQKTPTPLLLVLEEADEFAPQDPKGSNVPRMVGAANRISKRGRGRGIGMLYVTQRSAALNKNVLDQSDTLIVMRTIGPRDRAAIEGWVKHQDAHGMDEVLPSLPSLETGEAWVWTPERQLLKRVKIRKARTFDSSRTPRAGEAAIVATVKPIDVDQLGAAIAATVERAKASDPRELQKRIRQLESREREIEQLEAKASNLEGKVALLERATNREPERVEVPVFDFAKFIELQDALQLEPLSVLVEQLSTARDQLYNALEDLRIRSMKVVEAASRERAGDGGTEPDANNSRAGRAQPAPSRRPVRQPARKAPAGDVDLTGPQKRVLDAVAWLNAVGFPEPSKLQVGFVAGYRVGKRVGGTYGNILGQLRNDKSVYEWPPLIDYIGSGVVLTDAGAAIADVPDIEMSDDGLQAAIYARLTAPEQRVLENIVRVYPRQLTKQAAGELAGYTVGDRVGGTFGNILGRLRSLGLIEYPAQGMVRAEPVLFVDQARAA